MSNELFPGISFTNETSTSFVIEYEKITESPQFIESKKLTNAQALQKISDYLESATEYLKKKRLELN